MNVSAMIDQLGRRWRDPTFLVRTRPDWLDYLNKANQKFIKRARFPMSTATSDLAFAAGAASVALPADAWMVQSAYDVTNEQPLVPLYSRDQQQFLYSQVNRGDVVGYSIEDNDLFVFAIPRTALTVRVRVMTPIADMTDAAVAPIIPAHYHRYLMDGALELSFRDDQNVELAQAYQTDFNEGIADALREFTAPRLGHNVPLRNDYFETGVRPFRGG